MTLGVPPKHDDMFGSSRAFCEEHLAEGSIFRLLADEGHGLFPDEAFADLFKSIGRRSVAPRIVATVMVLQRLEGLSDREATERFIFDVRWKYAAGVPSEFRGFVHTVLVDMRERLRNSKRPNRIFETVLDVVKQGAPGDGQARRRIARPRREGHRRGYALRRAANARSRPPTPRAAVGKGEEPSRDQRVGPW